MCSFVLRVMDSILEDKSLQCSGTFFPSQVGLFLDGTSQFGWGTLLEKGSVGCCPDRFTGELVLVGQAHPNWS